MRYSTGGVRDYIPNGCSGPDLPATITEVRAFQSFYSIAGHTPVSTWENGDVWGSDFRDDGGDLDASGGSDLPEIYLFAGHGSCQNPPTSDDPGFPDRLRQLRHADRVNVGTSSRWGNSNGRLQFMFVDASCPMDLVSLANNWFPVFRGLHMATDHSGRPMRTRSTAMRVGPSWPRGQPACRSIVLAVSSAERRRCLDGCRNDRHPIGVLRSGACRWRDGGRSDRSARERADHRQSERSRGELGRMEVAHGLTRIEVAVSARMQKR